MELAFDGFGFGFGYDRFLVFGLSCCHTASNSITPEMHTIGVQ